MTDRREVCLFVLVVLAALACGAFDAFRHLCAGIAALFGTL